ncbi:MAG: sugar transferase [Lachnospiraceae bacterium]|nr:sugar transferase [Lachnospiraceae bacterium]
MDTEYINNWSLLTDIRLLGKTVQVVIRGDGAS